MGDANSGETLALYNDVPHIGLKTCYGLVQMVGTIRSVYLFCLKFVPCVNYKSAYSNTKVLEKLLLDRVLRAFFSLKQRQYATREKILMLTTWELRSTRLRCNES